MRRTALLGITALGALVLLAAIGFHNAILAAVIRGVAAPLGYSVRVDGLHAGLTGAVATGAAVDTRAGEPVLRTGPIAVQYSLRDLLPGSRRRFGLVALDVERPVLTLIHHADGTYNVTLPGGGQSAAPNTTPLDLRAAIHGGAVLLIDRFIAPGHERQVRIERRCDVRAARALVLSRALRRDGRHDGPSGDRVGDVRARARLRRAALDRDRGTGRAADRLRAADARVRARGG
jgi:hypothetical protein